MTTARDRAKQRRQKADEAEQAYEKFLDQLAAPLARQVVNALRAEGYAFTVSTPNRGLRVSLDAGRDDYIELALNIETDPAARRRSNPSHARLAHDRRRAPDQARSRAGRRERRRRAGVSGRARSSPGWSGSGSWSLGS